MKYFVCEPFTVKKSQGTATVPAGKALELSEDQAARLGGKVRPADDGAFDPAAAYDKIRAAQADLDRNIDWPELLTSFLADFHPDALRKIRNSTAAVDDAYRAGNAGQLDRALSEYKAAWLAGLDLYRQHQGDL